MRGYTGGLANEAFTSNPIVSSKQQLTVLTTTNCYLSIQAVFMTKKSRQKLKYLKNEKSF